jgi:hypothetical protein
LTLQVRRTIVEILYIAPSPKAGQKEHIDNATGATLVRAGFAQEIPAPKRGTNEHLAWKAERVAAITTPDPHDVVPEFVKVPVWEISTANRSGKPSLVFKTGSEKWSWTDVYSYEKGLLGVNETLLPELASCPKNLIDKFLELKRAQDPEVIAAANERAQIERQQAESLARKTEKSFMFRLGLVQK